MLNIDCDVKTVKELIEILLKINPETKLFTRYGEDGYSEGLYICSSTMHLNRYTTNCNGPHETYKGSYEPVQVCEGIIIG